MQSEYQNYEYSYLVNGKAIFSQTNSEKKFGKKLNKKLAKKKIFPEFYYHFRKGGHIEALRLHLNQKYFIKLDIKNFFPSVTRNKLTRDIKGIGFSYELSDRYSRRSTVLQEGKYSLPYGFVQSNALASLAMHKSRLGKLLNDFNLNEDLYVSVYVDDIIISSDSRNALEDVLKDAKNIIKKTPFEFNFVKTSTLVNENITSFNIDIKTGHMKVTSKKESEFLTKINEVNKYAILEYVSKINIDQAGEMARKLKNFDKAS